MHKNKNDFTFFNKEMRNFILIMYVRTCLILYGRIRKRKEEKWKGRGIEGSLEIQSPESPIKTLKSDPTVVIMASWPVMGSYLLPEILLLSTFAASRIPRIPNFHLSSVRPSYAILRFPFTFSLLLLLYFTSNT